MTVATLRQLAPEIILAVTALLVVIAGLFIESDHQLDDGAGERPRSVATAIALLGCVASLGAMALLISSTAVPRNAFFGTFVLDRFALFFEAILVVFAMVTVLVGFRFTEHFRPHQSEFIALILLATVGGMFMVSAREMIQLYVSLETLSIALYVLVAFNKGSRLSSEAGFKYLIVGAASSAVLLYGLAILYGLTGRTELDAVARQVAAGGFNSPALVLAMIFVIGGLSFKIAAVPFHQWVPDVYQGAPTPVTAFISVSSKAAGYGLLIRVLNSALLPMSHQWAIYLAVIAAITMVVGNVTALTQTSVKRLMGYSSIAHAGYIIMGLVAMADGRTATLAIGAVLFYILVYGLTNLAAFGALQAVQEGTGGDDLSSLAGVGRNGGGVPLVLALSMLSLTGIPPLIGFFAKFFVFLAAVQAGYAWLALIALVNSAVSSVYYLKVVRALYADDGPERRRLTVGPAMWTALGIGVLAILPLAAFANVFVQRAQDAAAAVLR
ncbi:MAG: NADH-quinone oxidoreductase subunit [Chloroflexota bacterium]|jgi:NADH-quinone oxidoreductase subunit N|nr:NADH-quinone oxidoreductase subunit [Chloroflexota bacterium]